MLHVCNVIWIPGVKWPNKWFIKVFKCFYCKSVIQDKSPLTDMAEPNLYQYSYLNYIIALGRRQIYM